ncbi:MAG TPA: Uma2 family endonuclease, partial [Humisphaera sp.]|nr:Uma2 family endonuclease [Humisphaera sp.]
YELIDGTLVEKPTGLGKSVLGMLVAQYLGNHVRAQKLGAISGPNGLFLLLPGLVRAPDVAFISRARMPGESVRTEAIPHVVPDLAIEVWSESNTRAEMDRKLREYFQAGVRLAWIIDHRTRAATVYSAADRSIIISEDGTLDGGQVVPGFSLSLKQLFADLEEAFDANSAPS